MNIRRSQQDAQLSFAIRLRTVGKYYGDLLLVVAVLNAVPMLFALVADGWMTGVRYVVPVAGLAGLGAGLGRLRHGKGIQSNEALVVVSAVFLTTSIAMALPLTGAGLRFGDALFEAISGVTTTGLSMADTTGDGPASFFFARAWLQWYGGLGIVVLSIALVMRPGPAARRLVASEDTTTDLTVGTRTHARQMLVVYGALTLLCFLSLAATGLSPFAAVTYTLSAVSTGGFSTHDESLAGVQGWPARFVVLLFSLLGAVSFALYYQAVRRRWRRALRRDAGVRCLLAVTLLVATALMLVMQCSQGFAWLDAIRHGVALGISAQTTTGFTTIDVADLTPAAKVVQILAMFVGGDMGSTAGGVKVVRLLIVLRLVQHLLLQTSVTAHTILPRRLAGEKLTDRVALDALLVITLFTATIVFSWTVFVVYGYRPLDALFDVVSATCTVGLSTGITSADLPGVLKGVLCADMLLGRLEVVALLVLVYPRTWIGKRANVT